MSFLNELEWRGLLHQHTGEDELAKHLQTPGCIGYAGFDPTADSLTIGNLIPLNLLAHWQRAGHKPVILMGGATGLVGDPSGKDAERQLRSIDEVRANVEAQTNIMRSVLDFDESNPNAAIVVNNYDWFKDISFLDALRDIGKHFSVNQMIQKDSVRDRLHNREQGISYTEFSYMLLQAYDFLHLAQSINCTVQMAGSDQFGNIVSGIDLIRRELGHEFPAFGLTAPLVTKSDGKKIGKTEKGAIWLSADRTSPYAFYQFWINADDADIPSFLKWFSLLPKDTVDDLLSQHEAEPHRRIAHRALAQHMTERLHGADEVTRVESATEALFGGDVTGLDEQTLGEVFADVPHSTHAKASLEGDGVALVELLPETTLASSKREAREFLRNGAVSVNGRKMDGEDATIKAADLLHGKLILLRRGKKKWHAARWE